VLMGRKRKEEGRLEVPLGRVPQHTYVSSSLNPEVVAIVVVV